MATVSFKFWHDCVDPQDLDAMWTDPDVRAEWLNVGETMGSKVHLSRDPDGQPCLTQTEMKDMLCAIAELESSRQPLATQYNKKTKDYMMGIMQISPKTAEWLIGDLSYQAYEMDGDSKLLYKPFLNVYIGAAYLKWLSNFEQIERSEEFMVRAYKGGTKKATHKSTLQYSKKYLSVKESPPSRKVFEINPVLIIPSSSATAISPRKGANPTRTTWDSRTSSEDIEEMWNISNVSKEWIKSGEKRGKLRLSHDTEMRPYLSRTELRAVARIILAKHFSTRGVKPCSEIVSARYVDGVSQRTGLMGINYSTARWLYNYKGYMVKSVEDLTDPFVSMYFGAAYMAWLSEYEGRERTPQFVVQAYPSGPQNVNLQETDPLWLKYDEALSRYKDLKKEQISCTIL